MITRHHLRTRTNLNNVGGLDVLLAFIRNLFWSGTYGLKVNKSISNVAIVCEVWVLFSKMNNNNALSTYRCEGS